MLTSSCIRGPAIFDATICEPVNHHFNTTIYYTDSSPRPCFKYVLKRLAEASTSTLRAGGDLLMPPSGLVPPLTYLPKHQSVSPAPIKTLHVSRLLPLPPRLPCSRVRQLWGPIFLASYLSSLYTVFFVFYVLACNTMQQLLCHSVITKMQ